MFETSSGLLDDRHVRRGLVMALQVPPFLYSWVDDRNRVAESLTLLRGALERMPPTHLAVPEMLTAARLIDSWLARWPTVPDQRPGDPGAIAWNEDVAPKLINTWERIAPLFESRSGVDQEQ